MIRIQHLGFHKRIRVLLPTLWFLVAIWSCAFNTPEHEVLIYFSDKGPEAARLIEQPERWLSARAIHRRNQQNIAFTHEDLPLAQVYLEQLKAIGGLRIEAYSKWLNVVLCIVPEGALPLIKALPFVDRVEVVMHNYSTPESNDKKQRKEKAAIVPDKPLSQAQLSVMGADALYQDGYYGKGKLIAVLDAGFPNYQSVFDKELGQIVATHNFVDPELDVDRGFGHGIAVTSLMLTKRVGEYIGSAPEASYLLLLTEDDQSETLREELFWAQAAAYADSAGADIINSSLGYSTFDEPYDSYTTAHLDGKTALISKAAAIAAKKGMLVITSAGNEGNKDWETLTFPADAFGVLSIGSFHLHDHTRSDFSSIGPTVDERVKPELLAPGEAVIYRNKAGEYNEGKGTSYAAPLFSGLAACIWQRYPELSAVALRNLLLNCGLERSTPTAHSGYGRIDITSLDAVAQALLDMHPNHFMGPVPIGDHLMLKEVQDWEKLEIYDLKGRMLKCIIRPKNELDMRFLSAGNYVFHLVSKSDSYRFQLTKL